MKTIRWTRLELLRSAAEHSPENAEYRLQLARQYAEIGWYEESCRLALDVLAEADAPADAYLLLADSLISIGRSDAAEALMLYALAHIENEAFILAAQRMLFEISMANRPEARKNRRAEYAERIAMRALKHLGEGEVEKAIQIFESCPPLSKNQSRIRVQYAAALCAANETDRAVSELETASRIRQFSGDCRNVSRTVSFDGRYAARTVAASRRAGYT